MILEFLPHRACDHILPTLLSVNLVDLLCHDNVTPPESLGFLSFAQCTLYVYILYLLKHLLSCCLATYYQQGA
jgi:hypothetical protein